VSKISLISQAMHVASNERHANRCRTPQLGVGVLHKECGIFLCNRSVAESCDEDWSGPRTFGSIVSCADVVRCQSGTRISIFSWVLSRVAGGEEGGTQQS
jgi:hypothetical protein